jgi:hypothetical protein
LQLLLHNSVHIILRSIAQPNYENILKNKQLGELFIDDFQTFIRKFNALNNILNGYKVGLFLKIHYEWQMELHCMGKMKGNINLLMRAIMMVLQIIRAFVGYDDNRGLMKVIDKIENLI